VSHIDRRVLLGNVAWIEPVGRQELIRRVMAWFSCPRSTARWNINLALQHGYLTETEAGYRLSHQARACLADYGHLDGRDGTRFARYCSGRPNANSHRRPSN
jgi:hypothetical protein